MSTKVGLNVLLPHAILSFPHSTTIVGRFVNMLSYIENSEVITDAKQDKRRFQKKVLLRFKMCNIRMKFSFSAEVVLGLLIRLKHVAAHRTIFKLFTSCGNTLRNICRKRFGSYEDIH